MVENYNAGVGEGLLKFEDVSDVCSSKRVHGLVAVANNEHVSVFIREFQHDVVLCRIGVLVFVYEHVLEALLIVVEDLRMAVE